VTQNVAKKPHTVHFVRLKDAVQDAIRMGLRYYVAKGIIDWKVKVIKSDPTGPADLPSICINRTSDREINQSLGDSFGQDRDPDNQRVLQYWGTNFKETLEIRIWTQNSDQRDLLYAITKAILFEYRPYLALKYGVVNQNITGGRDEASHVQQKGQTLYWGVIMFEAENSIQRTEYVDMVTDVSTELYSVNSASNGGAQVTTSTKDNLWDV
jgi:hypothetical protein